ncbi:MAG: hypothetical protein AAF570_11100, partial [Bacteroidota bacterium]
ITDQQFDPNTNALTSNIKTTITRDAYGSLLSEHVLHHIGGHQSKRTFTYYNDARPWVWKLGKVRTEVFWASTPGGSTKTTRRHFNWDGSWKHITESIREPYSPTTSPLYQKRVFAYDGYGNRTADRLYGHNGTAMEWRSSYYWYASYNRFINKTKNPVGHYVHYNPSPYSGKPLSEIDANSVTTTYTYDGLQRLKTESRPGEQTKNYSYYRYAVGSPHSGQYFNRRVIQAGKTNHAEVFDIFGVKLFDWKSKLIGGYHNMVTNRIIPDARGFIGAEVMPYKHGTQTYWIQTPRDVIGRKTSVVHPDGTSESYSYSGLVTTHVNQNNQTEKIWRNTRGEITQVQDNAGQLTKFFYDGFGNMFRAMDAQGHSTWNSFDQLGRKVSTTDPDMGAYTFKYNSFGDLVYQRDGKGQVRTMHYDQIGRLKQRVDNDGTANFTYDTNKKGRLTTESFNGFSISYQYDAQARLKQESHVLPGLGTKTFNYTYDGNGNVSNLQYPNGLNVQKTYTSTGELQYVKDAANGNRIFWHYIASDQGGRLSKFRILDGTARTTTRMYNIQNGRLERISTPYVQDLRYQYDNLGNMTQRKNQNTGFTENVGYDNMNRLTSSSIAGGPTLLMTYDAVGNMTYRSDAGCYEYPSSWSRKHAVQRLKDNATGQTIRTFAYDYAGNMTQNGPVSIAYNTHHKPVTMTKGSKQLQFQYGSDRRRKVQKTFQNGALQETKYYVNPLFEVTVTAAGAVKEQASVKAAGKVRAIRESGANGSNPQWRGLRYDHLGSVEYVTTESAAGLRKLDYQVWGSHRHPTNGNLSTDLEPRIGNRGFTHHEHLDMERIIHMNGRLYDPTIGRMMGADPVVLNAFSGQA